MLFFCYHIPKKTFSFWGCCPHTPTRGFAPGPHWGPTTAPRAPHHFPPFSLFPSPMSALLRLRLHPRGSGITYTNPGLLNLHAWLLCGTPCLHWGFHRAWRTRSPRPIVLALEGFTSHIGPIGFAGHRTNRRTLAIPLVFRLLISW